jgi:hypothetical protein
VRNGVNRLFMIVLLAALLVFAVLTAIEAGSRLAGGGPQLGDIDYRSWWSSAVDWDPGEVAEAAVFAAVALAGLLVLLAELRPSRARSSTVEIGRSPHGPVLLRVDTVAPYLRARIDERDFVRASAPHVQVTGTTAEMHDRPRTTRPFDESELAETRTSVTHELERMGLEPATVVIEPREPSGRGTRRVR